MTTKSIYDTDLDKNAANYQALTPLSFLERTTTIHPDRIAVVHGSIRRTYREFYDRSRRLASALVNAGIKPGDTVSTMLANTPEMLEAHFGVPMTGAVLHTMNTRLDARILAFQLDHSESRILFTDREFAGVVAEALKFVAHRPRVIDIDDLEFPQTGAKLGDTDYETFISGGDPAFAWRHPADEWEAIALGYTSGTTGNPKGVVTHHRGAHLMCYANTISAGLGRFPVYLWTLPMFHCNGWCFPWTITAVAGTHVCLRWVRPKAIYDAIADHRVTHMCGAPIVMSTMLNAKADEKRAIAHAVEFVTAGAPPPAAVLGQMAAAGFNVTHVYGLTETYGPSVVNEWKGEWDDKPAAEQAQLKSRQGVRYPALGDLRVMDPATMTDVPSDGETLGEVMFRGNIVMKGYLKNRAATEEAFAGGWFHSGDLGVRYPDGYVQLKDRSKDIIISGGENISSIEVEDVLYRHPAVAAAAVVAKPDEKWGETPCAFLELKPGMSATTEDIVSWCKSHLANYKVPRAVVFREIPKTSTGKIQKFLLRDIAKSV
ncbi:MAG TPA: acyl-CoA synthetase [Hyphomicrobiaceae bacterium]|nr:acyl-CoA synthetase [Hyphomicrobiaceae bacterium]